MTQNFDKNGKLTARIEVAPEELHRAFALREGLIQALKEQGYYSVLLDLEGYRRGKMNDVIAAQPLCLRVYNAPFSSTRFCAK